MADNEIRVVITGVASDLRRALDGAKGDLGGLKAAIKDVPNQVKVDVQAQTAAATERLRVLRDMAKDVPNRISIQADADTGVAEAKLRLLQHEARKTEDSIARVQLGGLLGGAGKLISGGGGGGAAGGGGILGSAGGAAQGIGTAFMPAVWTLLGLGAGPVIGSAGAGILGAGALGTAGLGTLAAGIGPLVALSGGLKDAIKLSGQLEQAQKNLASAQQIYGGQNKQLTTAQNNYNAAVAAFGPSSNAARSAHAQLLLAQQKQVAIAPQITSAQNALTKLQLQADPAVLAFATSWGKVGDAMQSAEQTILPAFATALRPVLDTFTALLPTLVAMARIDLSGISAFLKPLLAFANSSTFKDALLQLANTFAKLGGPLGQAATSLLRAFLSVAVAASPYLIQIADAFARWAKGFADSLSPGQHLNDLIKGLVGQLQSWWNLATALGRLMITVFSAGAGPGKALVDQLTVIVGKWNAWLNTTHGQLMLHKFFSDSVDLLKAVLGVLGPIAALIGSMAVGLIPTLTTLLKPVAALLATISQWINGLSQDLPPVLNALPGLAVAVGVLASWQALRGVVSATAGSMAGIAKSAAAGTAGKLGIAKAGAGLAETAAAGAGGAALGAAGATAAFTAPEGLAAVFGTGAISSALLGGGVVAAIGAAAAAALPVVLAGGAAIAAFEVAKHVFGGQPTVKVTPASGGTVATSGGATAAPLGALAGTPLSIAGHGSTNPLAGAALDIQSVGKFSNYSSTQLRQLIADLRVAASVKVNGITESKNEVLKLAQAALAVKDRWNSAFNSAWSDVNAFYRNTSRTLPALYDDFNSNMRRIAATVGTQSKAGKDLMALNVTKMVQALTQGMLSGKITVASGMGALNSALKQGLDAGAITWDTQWHDMFSTVTDLYKRHKIDTQTYLSDLGAITAGGMGRIRDETKASLDQRQADLKSALDKGQLTQGQYEQAVHAANTHANETQRLDMQQFASHVIDAMVAAGTASDKGVAAIIDPMNNALKALGQKPITLTSIAVAGASQAITQGVKSVAGGLFKAGGGLVQVGRAGERGRDTVPLSVGGHDIVVGAGEQVAVFNHDQQQAINARLAGEGGLPGFFAANRSVHHMASGGLLGNVPAMIAEANRVTAQHYPYLWGGGHGSFQGPYDCSGAVSDILHAGGVLNAPRVSGDFMSYGLPGPGAVTLYANPTHVYMSIDGRFFGTSGSNPGGGAGWFPGAPRPGFAVRHIGGGGTGGGGFGPIAAPKWTGPGGALGQIGKGALAKVTAAANQKLSGAQATAFGGSFGGGQHSENLANQQIGQQMMLAAGWPMSEWGALQALWSQESGWDANAVNPSSGAYGIPQALGHGHPFALGDVRAQVAWGLDYIRGRYGSPSAAEAHERAFNWYGSGGLVQMLAGGGALGSQIPSNPPLPGSRRPRTPRPPHRRGLPHSGAGAGSHTGATRPAKKPPATAKHTHTRTKPHTAKLIPADALKNLLSADQLKPERNAAAYDRQVTVDDQLLSNLLAAQAVNAVDDPPLVTLSDADVAALDPSGQLGYQTGDQIVNRDGMVAGRFFGPGGAIQGGTFHPGVSARMGQLAAILANRNDRLTALRNEQGALRGAVGVDTRAIDQREKRKERIERYLHASVVRANVVKRELDVLKSKNLAQALSDALSKQSIGRRLTGLRGHLRTVTDELGAEKRSQAELIPQARDPTHTIDLEAQAANIRDSIAVETQLGQSGNQQVQQARSAIFAHNLTGELATLQKTNTDLGGKPLEAGSGGTIGTILSQMKTIGTDRDTRQNTLADFMNVQLVPAYAEIAGYVREQGDLGKLANIQVRTPTPAAGPDLSALNQLLQTQLQQTQQALAISQAQFGVFQGFAPLLQGRLLGSFATGIDRVPRTGPYLLHRDEMVVPDPYGPHGNRAAASVQTAQGPVEIVINMANNDAPLMKVIDARVNERALRVVSDHSGQRARLMAGVRRP